MAVRQHTRVRRDVEVTCDGGRQCRKRTWLRPGVKRLHVAAGEARLKLGLCEGH
jgi:hypothetical protein